jgi:hypothetical protein
MKTVEDYPKYEEINLSEKSIQALYYSFRYRDWSKEAMMDLAESIVF